MWATGESTLMTKSNWSMITARSPKSPSCGVQILQLNVRRKIGEILTASPFLQTVKSDLGNTEDRQEFMQGTITVPISAVVGIVRPDDADFGIIRRRQKQRRIFFAPAERRRINVGNSCWNRVEGCFENMRQARERQISIKFRHANLSWFAELADARYRREDRHQLCGTGEDQILTALRCQGKIAGKLKRIAGYLSRVDHQGLLGYRMAVPFGVRAVEPIEWPPLALGKTPRIVADLKEVQAEVKVRLGVIRLQLDGPLIVTNRLVGLAEPAGDISQDCYGPRRFHFRLR